MKWQNRGHEFDFLEEKIIYGAQGLLEKHFVMNLRMK